MVVAVLFILSIFIAPIFSVLAGNSWFLFGITSPALVIVGVLMMKVVKDIDWNDMEEAIPSFLTVAMMPFAYSISEGIAFGFISYTLIKVLKGKFKQVPVLLYILSVLFIVKYILAGL